MSSRIGGGAIALLLGIAGAPPGLAQTVERVAASPRSADWPEETGRLSQAAATHVLGLLDRAANGALDGDGTYEARYRRALVKLEPLATHDVRAAAVDLQAVAAAESPWSGRARYALAWLHEQRGEDDRALDAYQRLLVDAPATPEGLRARVGLARVLLRHGECGAAARWLQEAIGAGVAADTRAAVLRELAVRTLLREAGEPDPSRPHRRVTGVRSPVAFATTAAGGVLLGDRKQGSVIEIDSAGTRVGQWPLEALQTVATDPRGGRFAAAGATLYRLDDAGVATPLASLGDYPPLSALAADDTGGFWIADRRGRRVGRIEPGQDGPAAFWEGEGSRLQGLVWGGHRLLAIDTKARGLVASDGRAQFAPLPLEDGLRPLDLAVDAAGRTAVLDGRSGTVRFLRRDGRPEARAFASVEIPRPVAIDFGPEGELHLLDSDGAWLALR